MVGEPVRESVRPSSTAAIELSISGLSIAASPVAGCPEARLAVRTIPASAAPTPESRKAVNRASLVLMPESFAAFALPPMAYQVRPSTVAESRNQTRSISTTAITTGTGTGPMLALAEPADGVGQTRCRGSVAEQQRESGEAGHRGQRCNERGQSEVRDGHTVDRPGEQARAQSEQNCRDRMHPADEQLRHQHSDEAGQCADREVDVTGCHDDGLHRGDNREHGDLLENGAEVRRGEKALRRQQREERDQTDQSEKGAERGQSGRKPVGPGAGGRPAWAWCDGASIGLSVTVLQNRRLVGVAGREESAEPPLAQHGDLVGETQQFRDFRRHHDHCHSGVGEAPNRRINLGFRVPMSTPRVGSSSRSTRGLRSRYLASMIFC